MVWMLLAGMALGKPASFQCDANEDAFFVYPSPAAVEVPVNSVLTVLRDDLAVCGFGVSDWGLQILDGETVVFEAEDLLDSEDLVTRRELDLAPLTTYTGRLTGEALGVDAPIVWTWTFTTGEADAVPGPPAPLTGVTARFDRVDGQVKILPLPQWATLPEVDELQVLELLHDGEVVSARALGHPDGELPEPEGEFRDLGAVWRPTTSATWFEDDKPSEVCLEARFVNAAGEPGESVERCGPVERYPRCQAVGAGPAGGLLATLLGLGLVRRRRRRSGQS